jgi:hypothetical protein
MHAAKHAVKHAVSPSLECTRDKLGDKLPAKASLYVVLSHLMKLSIALSPIACAWTWMSVW